MALEWKLVYKPRTYKPIGAVGFNGDDIVVIAAFYEDKDWDDDGKVSLLERFVPIFSGKGRAIAEVVTAAYSDPDIMIRDPSIRQWYGNAIVNFANGMIVEGIYKVYFSQAIGMAAGSVAGSITQNTVKSYLIKKGLETTVKQLYMKTTKP
jgi:hypothetical protein